MRENKLVTLLAEDCVQVGDSLIFIAKDVNFVFSLNLDTGKVELIDSIPEEDVLAVRLGASIAYWKNELIFTPMKAEKIWIYNLQTKEWRGLEREKIENGRNGKEMFQSILYGNKLFLIGSNYPAIICLDLLTESMTYIKEPYVELKEKKEMLKDCYFRCDYAQKDNYIYLASCLSNFVLKFDMDTCKYDWIKVGKDKNRYAGIKESDEGFWLAPRCNTAIVKWDGEKEIVEYSLPKTMDDGKFSFVGVVVNGDKIVFPGMSEPNTVIITDLEQGEMENVQEQYLFYKKINSGLVVSMTVNGEVKVYYPAGKINNYVCGIEKEKIVEYFRIKNFDIWKSCLCNDINENSIFDMVDFCDFVVEKRKMKSVSAKENYGEIIWGELREGV